jgi:hypothetical protein
MKKGKREILSAVFLLVFLSSPCFTQTVSPQIEPYTKDEFPQWARDIRRTEIITFGSFPFVMLVSSLVYSTVLLASGRVDSFPNPFVASSDGLSSKDQINILIIAGATSVAIGLTDLTINLVKRNIAKKRAVVNTDAITVTPAPSINNDSQTDEEVP